MDQGSEQLLDEPLIVNALFKYAILQAEKLKMSDFQDPKEKVNVYQPDTNAILRILHERGNQIPNPFEIFSRLPEKKQIPLEPHEFFQRILLQNNNLSSSSSSNTTDDINMNGTSNNHQASNANIMNRLQQSKKNQLAQGLINPFQQTQLMAQQIESITSCFAQGKVEKCDQDADLKDLEMKLSSENGGNSIEGENNGIGSSDNLSNENEVGGGGASNLKCIQKRMRRPRGDQIVKKVKEDTKNLLRNYGNAQTRFILCSGYSKKMMDSHFDGNQDQIEEFKKWVMQQKLENFEQFKNIWHVQDDDSAKDYKFLFREICFDFYENHASVYVLGSQMRSEDTRKTHIKYIWRFLDGIVHPSSFYYFKKN